MRSWIVLFSVGVLAACHESTVEPPQPLDGTWVASNQPVTGTGEVLSLIQRGDSITGTGTYLHGSNPPTGTMTVAGTYNPPRIVLNFRYDYGTTSVFTGTMPDSLHIVGTEAGSTGGQFSLTFTKQ